MSTIIECPACTTRYKMNKPIPEGGRSVKCARCAHQWRIVPEEPEELTEAFEAEESAAAPGGGGEQFAAAEDAATGPAPGFHESQAGFPGQPPASSWEARRGNLAAAIAAMSDGAPADTTEHQDGSVQEDAAFAEGWTSDAAESDAPSDEPRVPGHALFSGMGGAAEDDDDAPISSPPAWLRNTSWDETRKAADDIDPEQSVRQVLQAAFDDPDDAREDAAQGGDSTLSRPVFADSAAEDTTAVVSEEGAAALANAFGDSAVPADDPYAEAQKGLAARWDAFGSQPATAGEPAATAFSTEGDETSEKFENDIAGIFRQELQAKRSFGHSATKRSSQAGFTDYDEAGSGSEAADDRYMADSPLDADAAALQAALEGSLREKHPAEPRSASGGLALAAAWAVFICVLSGVTMAFISFRDEIVVALPGTAPLYRSVGLGVQDQQIDFGAVNYRWTVADGKPMIEVTGQIINLTDSEITVPRVLINVHDKENADTVKATATLRSEPLSARETADFTLEFISPSKTISQIELAFAERTE